MPLRLNAKYLSITETLNVLPCLYWRMFADAIVDILSPLHTSLLTMLITKKVKLINPSFLETCGFDNEQNNCNQKLINISEEEVFISSYILCKVCGDSFFHSYRVYCVQIFSDTVLDIVI